MKKALIFGVGGQDGFYLASFLIDKGYEVHGAVRNSCSLPNGLLSSLGINEKIFLHSADVGDFSQVSSLIGCIKPDEIYNLAGQSSVGLSFVHPVETFQGFALGAINILESIRAHNQETRFFNAGSGECFGDSKGEVLNEGSAFRPSSPYAVAKASAHWLVVCYRESYKLSASNGILFNHESPIRPTRFVTQKIVDAACAIALGRRKELLTLGDISISRDWGWAPEYVEAMWLVNQQEGGGDYIVATGRTVPLQYFVEKSFSECGLDYKNYVVEDRSLFRPSEVEVVRADPGHIFRSIGWRHNTDVDGVVKKMVAYRMRELSSAYKL